MGAAVLDDDLDVVRALCDATLYPGLGIVRTVYRLDRYTELRSVAAFGGGEHAGGEEVGLAGGVEALALLARA